MNSVFLVSVVIFAIASDSSVGNGLTAPFLLECRIPENLPNVTFKVNFTEEESEQLEFEGRCFLGCARERYGEQFGSLSYNLSEYWPYINDSGVECDISGKVHECTRGCIRALGYFEFHTDCIRICSGGCNMECEPFTPQCHPWIHMGCPITCVTYYAYNGEHPCRLGCRLEEHLYYEAIDGDLPLDPEGPPVLIPERTSRRAGHFFVDLRSAAPQPEEDEEVNRTSSAVTFLLRFEEVNSTDVFFNWTVNPFVEIDLSSYACQDLLVSFAVSNQAGLSNFSDSTQITVHGDERLIPNLPSNISISEEVDKRIGFFGHVILNISWEPPQNDAYLDTYTIDVESDTGENRTMCGYESWSHTVPNSITSVSVVATSSHALPVMSCRYRIQLHGVGQDGGTVVLINVYRVESTFNPEEVTFECQRLWQIPDYVYWFNLTWTLPPYLRHGNVINDIIVVPQFKEGSSVISVLIDNVTFPFPLESLETVTEILKPSIHEKNTTYYLPQHLTTRVYYLMAFMTWNSTTNPYIPPRHAYTCSQSALSPPPSLVENFTVNSYTINGSQITLDLDWSPPTMPNGQLGPYSVCIGGVPLGNIESPDTGGGHTCTSLSKEITNEVTLFHVQHDFLYVQIRAHNLFVPGNWSEPFVINTMEQEEMATISTNTKSTPESGGIASSNSGAGAGVGLIVGVSLTGAVLAMLLLCCFCLIVCYVKRLRQRKRIWRMTQPCDPMFISGPKNPFFERPSASSMNAQLMDDWEIPANEVIMEKLLGEGAFGEVYKGIIKCPIVNPRVPTSVKSSFCTPVAIKLLKLSAKGNERQDFLSEIEMMKKVAEGQNPHVVCLVGCVTIQEPLCLITEFVKYGDLLSYLRTNRRMFTGSNTEEEADEYIELGKVSSVDLICFAYQIASGMEYLSSLGIVHRDLAARNILVDEGKVLKISDLGMSRETDEIYVMKRTGRVPLKWMAIESIIAREFTSASDVWSYGVILWEIGTLGGFPYPTIQNDEFLPLLKRGYRMEKPDNCSHEVYDIMLKCWDELPQKRPTFAELRAKFDAMLLADRNEEYIDLRIDQSKLYYQLLTTKGDSCSQSSAVSLHHHHSHTDGEYSPSKSPKSSFLASASPALKSRCNNSTGHMNRRHNSDSEETCRNAANGSERDRLYVNSGRPVSMYLSREQDKKDRENPYVDEPSRQAANALALPTSNEGPAHWRSEGAIDGHQGESIELQTRESTVTTSAQNGLGPSVAPQIKISLLED